MDPNTDDMGYVTLLNWKTFSLESKYSQQIYVKAAKKHLVNSILGLSSLSSPKLFFNYRT